MAPATSAVVVDVVARDKKGPVIDLTQADFEVYEDGKLQQIVTFERRAPDALLTRVGGESATGVGTREAAMPPVVVALAWDRLTPEGRVLANKAAQGFVSTRQSQRVGRRVHRRSVAENGRRLHDRRGEAEGGRRACGRHCDHARRARAGRPARFACRASVRPGDGRRGVRRRHRVRRRRRARRRARAPIRRPSAPPRPKPPRGRPWIAWTAAYLDLQSNVEGQASMNALLALVDSLGALPGRKTVVYFCEGLTVAPAVEAKFRSIIATANRKNVSVYALDAAGLRAHSKQTETAPCSSRLVGRGGDGRRTQRQQEVDRGSRSQRADAEERSVGGARASSRARPAAC